MTKCVISVRPDVLARIDVVSFWPVMTAVSHSQSHATCVMMLGVQLLNLPPLLGTNSLEMTDKSRPATDVRHTNVMVETTQPNHTHTPHQQSDFSGIRPTSQPLETID